MFQNGKTAESAFGAAIKVSHSSKEDVTSRHVLHMLPSLLKHLNFWILIYVDSECYLVQISHMSYFYFCIFRCFRAFFSFFYFHVFE